MMNAPPPGQGPSPEQIAHMQQLMAAEAQRRGLTVQQFQEQQRAAIAAEAQKAGMSVEQYINQVRAQAFAQQQQQMQTQGQQATQGDQPSPEQQQEAQQQQIMQPVQPGPPSPEALALAKWLRTQDLKTRTCILNGDRKDLLRGTSLYPRRPSGGRSMTAQATITSGIWALTSPRWLTYVTQ